MPKLFLGDFVKHDFLWVNTWVVMRTILYFGTWMNYFPYNVNYEYENTEHKSILMVKCLCWMFMLLSFKKNVWQLI